jgi:hypothetical protein
MKVIFIKTYLLPLTAILSAFTFNEGFAQNPIPYNSSYSSSGNINITAGINNIQASIIHLGPTTYNINGSATSDALADLRIDLTDGFRAGTFTGSGYIHLQIGGMSVASYHQNGFNSVPQFEKFELGVHLPGEIQQKVDNFLDPSYTGTDKLNPYDPDQIKITCDFIHSQGTPRRYGFYYVPFTTSPSSNPAEADLWVDQATDYSFRVRFAPPWTGSYTGYVYLSINNQATSYYSTFVLNVVPSSNKGHLDVTGNPNIQKLKYTNGDIFYGIATDIPWADEAVYDNAHPNGHPAGPWNGPFNAIAGFYAPSTHNTHDDQRGFITDFANNSGNFVRIRLDEWSVPIETFDLHQPICTTPSCKTKYLTNYHHNQPFMWEMDNTVATCENLDVKILLTLNLGAHMMGEWNVSPYSGLLGDNIVTGYDSNGNPLFDATNRDKFFDVSSNINGVIDIYKKRLFYILARWGYSTSIGAWELINETEFIYETPAGHFNPNLPSLVEGWHCEMANYLRGYYPGHPVTTGAINLEPLSWGKVTPNLNYLAYINHGQTQSCLDIFTAHCYFVEWDQGHYADASSSATDQLALEHSKYWFTPTLTNSKAFIWGEWGNERMDVGYKSKFSFHDAVWRSIFSNSIGNAMQWNNWQDGCNSNAAPDQRFVQFNAVKQFTDRINFGQLLLPDRNVKKVAWRPTTYSFNENPLIPGSVFTYWMRDPQASIVFGWTRNTTANWSVDSYTDQSPTQNFRLCALDPGTMSYLNSHFGMSPNQTFPLDPPGTMQTVMVQGLAQNSQYCVEVFDAWDPSGSKLMSFQAFSNFNGVLTFQLEMPTFPFVKPNGEKVYPDYAFILDNDPEKVCEGGGRVKGPATQISSNEENRAIRVYPNPAKDKLWVQLSDGQINQARIRIVDEIGRKFDLTVDPDGSIDLRQFVNGYYTLQVATPTNSGTFKLVIQK